MKVKFTLEHWLDDGWYVGRLKEVPGVFSQGETLEELKNNIILTKNADETKDFAADFAPHFIKLYNPSNL